MLELLVIVPSVQGVQGVQGNSKTKSSYRYLEFYSVDLQILTIEPGSIELPATLPFCKLIESLPIAPNALQKRIHL